MKNMKSFRDIVERRAREYESPIEEKLGGALGRLGVAFVLQEPIAGYFADFFLPEHGAVIECDGKAFHDGAKDGRRDEAMRAAGFRVYRVTGSEINRSPILAAFRVMHDMTGNPEWAGVAMWVGDRAYPDPDRDADLLSTS